MNIRELENRKKKAEDMAAVIRRNGLEVHRIDEWDDRVWRVLQGLTGRTDGNPSAATRQMVIDLVRVEPPAVAAAIREERPSE